MLRKVVCILAFVAACGDAHDASEDDLQGQKDASTSGSTGGAGGAASGGGQDAGGSASDEAGTTRADAGMTGNTSGGGTRDAGSAGGGGADSGPDGGGTGGTGDASTTNLAKFSFFVTSLASLRELSKSQSGFGGDLRFGETGDGAGLRGADKICSTIAENSMPGSSAKQWRAFLSSSSVNAKDRIGQGPWYDRKGRVLAMNLTALLKERPEGAATEIVNDFPNEFGVPNHDPDGTGNVDNHDMLTGTNTTGTLYCPSNAASCTCNDWTSAEATGKPRVGHSWPRSGGGGGGFGGGGGGGSMNNWMSALDEAGCAPGVSLIEMGPPMANNPTVGSGGGYGGFYCFALTP
jgi:hypothetical protein